MDEAKDINDHISLNMDTIVQISTHEESCYMTSCKH